MKTRTVTERIGEWFPLNREYDHMRHARPRGSGHPESTEEGWKNILMMDDDPEGWFFCPSDFSAFRVVQIGMYDGWPYWSPTPAIGYIGPLGGIEVGFFYRIYNRRVFQRKGE